jgi:deoxyribodipyrimidine photo-lyase
MSPSQSAALGQLNRFVSQGRAGPSYTNHRNIDLGANQHQHVSQLSPYISCRLLLETQVLRTVLSKHTAASAEKFIQEICWRTYWKGWLQHNPVVWHSYCQQLEGLMHLPAVLRKQHEQVLRAATGIDCFDAWVAELIDTGYLHNHARMWFASIWIFTLRLPWQLGASFFMQHLLDADAASNTLSWRWVGGLQTVGKHYLAKADNIARYTNGRFNPTGLLDENAHPLVEAAIAPTPITTQIEKPIPKWRQHSVESGVLLLHESDLSPEVELGLQRLGGLVWVAPKAATPVTAFKQGAMQDAVQRLTDRFHIAPDHIIKLSDTESLVEVLGQHRQLAQQPLYFATLPVGPSRDHLAPQIAQWVSAGHTAYELTRQWDEIAWPHARKGFFGFKTKIPALLESL